MHVVTRYANGIEAGHSAGTIAKYLGNDLHGRTRWVDVGVANHKLFEDIVLNGTAQLMGWNPAFFGRNNKKCQDGDHCSVHGHADRQLVQRQIPEQDLHILHRVNGDSGLAYIGHGSGMIRIVTAMGG